MSPKHRKPEAEAAAADASTNAEQHTADTTNEAAASTEQPTKERKSHRLTAEAIKERYPHADVSTLRWDTEGTHANKQTVEADLPCGHRHRIATSDLFQVRSCPSCRRNDQREKRKAKRHEKAAARKAAKAAAEAAPKAA